MSEPEARPSRIRVKVSTRFFHRRILRTAFVAVSMVMVISFPLVVVLHASTSTQPKEVRTVKVALHIVKGSGVTLAQMKGWLAKANQVWGKHVLFVQDPSSALMVQSRGANFSAGSVNVYGTNSTANKTGPNPGNAGETDRNFNVEVGASAPDSSMAHEFGHWFGASPDNTTSPSNHGNPVPGGGRDTDGDGDDDADDKKNIMYPGQARGNGTSVDPHQGDKFNEGLDTWVLKVAAKEAGRGMDLVDSLGDVPLVHLDIYFAETWTDAGTLNMRLLLSMLDHFQSSQIGFFLETDNNPATGQPPEGLDYYVAFNPQTSETLFQIFDGGWHPLNPSGISMENLLLLRDEDVADEDVPVIGAGFSLRLSLLARREGNSICYKSQSTNGFELDVAPDSGLVCIATPPPVGGIVFLVDKLSLLAPYVAIPSMLVAATVAAFHLRRTRPLT